MRFGVLPMHGWQVDQGFSWATGAMERTRPATQLVARFPQPREEGVVRIAAAERPPEQRERRCGVEEQGGVVAEDIAYLPEACGL